MEAIAGKHLGKIIEGSSHNKAVWIKFPNNHRANGFYDEMVSRLRSEDGVKYGHNDTVWVRL